MNTPPTEAATGAGDTAEQRIALKSGRSRLDLPDPEDTVEAPLARQWKNGWASGDLSSAKLHHYALKASKSNIQDMDALAAKARKPSAHTNMHRMLMQYFGNPKGAPEIDWYEVPYAATPSIYLAPQVTFVHVSFPT